MDRDKGCKENKSYKNISQYIEALHKELISLIATLYAEKNYICTTDLMGNINLISPDKLSRLSTEELYRLYKNKAEIKEVAKNFLILNNH